MKDFFKRVIIVVVVFMCIVIFVLGYFSNIKREEDLKNLNEQSSSSDTSIESTPKDDDEVESYSNSIGRVTANLNFRDYPSTQGKVLATISKGDTVELIAKTRNNWYKARYNEKEGYITGEYVNILSEDEISQIIAKTEFQSTYGVVSIDTSLNVRKEANKSSEVLTTVKSGSILKIEKQMENGWYYVEGNKVYGYVSDEYVKILTEEEYNLYSSDKNNLLDESNNIIATYTSTSTYNKNSRYNMHLAADYINGTVVAPGETYSHLSVVHPEGEENKYVKSTIFVNNGQTAQATGGGICQTSSTVYAAIVSAKEQGINTGFNVTAQAPHSGKVNYVPRKYEATVNTGTQDFCFRNCNSYSIKITAQYDYNTLTITIYKI